MAAYPPGAGFRALLRSEKDLAMVEELLDLAIATAGGRELWSRLRGLKIDLSVGGPIWATKGWPPGETFDQTVTLDTIRPESASNAQA